MVSTIAPPTAPTRNSPLPFSTARSRPLPRRDQCPRRRRARLHRQPHLAAKGVITLQIGIHGAGDNKATWTEFGKANLFLDNLIAAKETVPMIIVITGGHAKNTMDLYARAKNTSVFIDVPAERIDAVLATRPGAPQLFDHGWIHLIALQANRAHRYTLDGWRPV